MSNNKIAIAGAVGAAIFFLTKKDKIENSTPYTPGPTATGTSSETQGQGPISLPGIGGIDRIINYETWNRKNWSNYLQQIYMETSPIQASQTIWQAWQNEDNPYRSNFPTIESLIFNLSLYKEDNYIGDPFIVTADSIPIYETWTNTWGGQPSWDCEQWQQWYNKLEDKYGAQVARDKWANAWTYEDNFGFKWRLTAGQWCGIDCDFINYFRLKGIDVAYTGAETTCTLVSIPYNLLDATSNVSSGIVNVSEGLESTTQLLSTLAPIVIVGGLGLLAYKTINK